MNLLKAERDIAWYFQDSESEMGISSSFESMRMSIMLGGGGSQQFVDTMTDRRINATHRHRQIHTRIQTLTPTQQEVLSSVYESGWEQAVLDALGQAAGAAVHTPAAQKYYLQDSPADRNAFNVWLTGVVHRNEKERIQMIRREATDLYKTAVRAYACT